MAGTLLVLVYATASMRALRTIVPDYDAEVADITARLRDGEALVTIPKAEANGVHFLQNTLSLVEKHHGLTIGRPVRCVILDASGTVVDHGMIEPALYQPPQNATPHMERLAQRGMIDAVPEGPFTIVEHEIAQLGDVFMDGAYQPKPDPIPDPAVAAASQTVAQP